MTGIVAHSRSAWQVQLQPATASTFPAQAALRACNVGQPLATPSAAPYHSPPLPTPTPRGSRASEFILIYHNPLTGTASVSTDHTHLPCLSRLCHNHTFNSYPHPHLQQRHVELFLICEAFQAQRQVTDQSLQRFVLRRQLQQPGIKPGWCLTASRATAAPLLLRQVMCQLSHSGHHSHNICHAAHTQSHTICSALSTHLRQLVWHQLRLLRAEALVPRPPQQVENRSASISCTMGPSSGGRDYYEAAADDAQGLGSCAVATAPQAAGTQFQARTETPWRLPAWPQQEAGAEQPCKAAPKINR